MPELKLEHSLVDDRYEVHERLGLGSYAEIWVARDHGDGGREVVLKALNTSLQGTPDAELERTLVENFQNEAVALDTVRHPHVILRLGHGTAADLRGVPFHYLALEYMAGGDLLRLCRQQPGNRLPLERALFYFKQTCEALAYAHSQGIIHRDLKPNNLLLGANHQMLKVADFGVAKLTTGEEAEITRVGAGIYAPPEHHPDEQSGRSLRLTAAADIYSLAKSFYTVICGRAPSQFICDPIKALPEVVRAEPWADELLKILCRATADEVYDRYATVIEFWSDLANIAVLDEREEEETQVRPRLNVAPSDVPDSPAQPEFNPVLASSGAQVTAVSAAASAPLPATPVAQKPVSSGLKQAPVAAGFTRKPRIVVDLKTKPAAVERMIEEPAPAIVPPATPARRFDFKEQFSETLRRRAFIALLAAAFLGLLVSTYHFVRNNGLGGTPAEIEVVTENLNVRLDPNSRAKLLGVIAKGSKHRVLGQNGQGWLQIEVAQWNEGFLHVQDQNRGWINGDEEFVRVSGRRWWFLDNVRYKIWQWRNRS